MIHGEGRVTLNGRTGTIRLPAEYVEEHLELGYAQTSHATQGRTVDTALLLLDAPTDSRGIYTPKTRGRNANDAYVVTDEARTAVDVLTQAITRDWIDQPATVRRIEHRGSAQDPPSWRSIEARQHCATDPGRAAEPDRESGPTEDGGVGERMSNEEHHQRRMEQALAAIERRRRSITREPSRDHQTLGL